MRSLALAVLIWFPLHIVISVLMMIIGVSAWIMEGLEKARRDRLEKVLNARCVRVTCRRDKEEPCKQLERRLHGWGGAHGVCIVYLEDLSGLNYGEVRNFLDCAGPDERVMYIFDDLPTAKDALRIFFTHKDDALLFKLSL
jgi:hypothetical protein